MGKISRGRRKYHAAGHKLNARKAELTEALSNDDGCSTSDIGLVSSYNPLPINFTLPNNLFAGIDISGDDLKQQLDVRSVADDDTRSIVSKKSFKSERPYKKKEKRQLRREVFMMKLNAALDAKIQAKARRKRQQTVIVGDMQPLADALPEITIPVKPAQPTKLRSIPKAKKRQQMFLQDLAIMHEAIKKQNPKLSQGDSTSFTSPINKFSRK